jgi:hypothetical protein
MQNFLRIFSIVALLVIAGYALTITGSPAHTRMVNEDIDTLEEMEDLHGALIAYHNRNGQALHSLDNKALNALESGTYGKNNCGNYYNGKQYEGIRLKEYEYTPQKNGYKICTNFNTSWEQIKLNQRLYGNRYLWAMDFQKGRPCFERTYPECKKRN